MFARVGNIEVGGLFQRRRLAISGLVLFAGLLFAGLPVQAYQGKGLAPQQQAAAATTFCNSALISIPEGGESTPYPAPIAVSGLSGRISDVSVQLHALRHNFYGDIDMLLVGPHLQSVLLMSDTCDTCHATGVNLTFHDGMPALPTTACPVSGSTYSPTNYDFTGHPPDSFPAPAPKSVDWTGRLSIYNGTDPNGTWNLYVVDDFRGFYGRLESGWCVSLTTVPTTGP